MDRAGPAAAQSSDEIDPVRSCWGLGRHELRVLLGLVAGTDVVELEVGFPGGQITIRREAAAIGAGTAEAVPEDEAEPVPDESLVAITSPLVGTFRPGVRLGDDVDAGQTVGAVEAMGMPTPVDVPSGGIVVEILAPEGTPVEYGQPLLVLRRPVA